jgi:NAD(P)-dependent dehydrogenase (short-subunit alcohol dehydrogenase family)
MRALDEVAAVERIDRSLVARRRLADVPMGRLARPAEIADALVWLAELGAAAPLVGVIAGGETFR